MAGIKGAAGTGGNRGEGGGGTAGVVGTDGGSPAATFTEVYSMVLGTPATATSSCAGMGCHNPGSQFGLTFDTKADAYRTLIGTKFVVPGSAATSTLSLLLTTTVTASRMPLGRPMLSAKLIALVNSWINAGALDN